MDLTKNDAPDLHNGTPNDKSSIASQEAHSADANADDDEPRQSVHFFGSAFAIPDSISVDCLKDFLSGEIDDLPQPRRPFGNTTSSALNAIDGIDDEIERFFMLKDPSDEIRDGAATALIYVLSELNADDATFFGLLGGAIARFMQCIPELAPMVNTSDMDQRALLKPG
jgi:hypothetical protein